MLVLRLRLILIFIALGLLCFGFQAVPAHAAISLVQATSSATPFLNGAGTSSVTFASNVTAGTTLIILTLDTQSGATGTISDTAGNTFTFVTSTANAPSNNIFNSIYYVTSTVGGADTVNFYWTSKPAYAAIAAFEYSGLLEINLLDKIAVGSATNNTSSATTGNITTTAANELLFSFVGDGASYCTSTPGWVVNPGWTIRSNSYSATNHACTIVADRNVTSTGNYQNTFSMAPATSSMYAVLASFQAPSPPTIASFSAASSLVASAGTSTLSWSVTNASSVAITPGSFSTSTLIASTTVNPTSTTVYTLTATNANGTSTATTTVTVDTTAPSVPAGLTITSTTQNSVSLAWASSTDPDNATSSLAYDIDRCAGSCSPSTTVATTSNVTYADTGLSPGTLYTYAISAFDPVGNTSALSSSTATTTLPAAVPTVIATSSVVATSSATLVVTVAATGGASSTVMGVNYGLTSAYGSVASTTGSFGSNTTSSFSVPGILCNTTYHYQGFATNTAGTGASTDQTFTTNVCITNWPIAAGPSMASAAITWRTPVSANSQVNYGPSASYGSSVSSSSLALDHALILTGLSPNTIYHYQVASQDSSGNAATSTDRTFTTLTAPAGIVKTVKAGGGGDYTTISACANDAVAGSVSSWSCEVFPGTYNEVVSLSGFTGSPSNQITFVANGDVVVAGFNLANSSYVNITGFEITTSFAGSSYESCSTPTHGVYLNITNHITISSNYIHHMYNGSFVEGPYHVTSSYISVLNNIMAFADMQSYTGNPVADAPCGSVTGGRVGIEGYGNYDLIDGNVIEDADHLIEIAGNYNVFRRNIAHDTNPADWQASSSIDHIDFFHPLNSSLQGGAHSIHEVIEGNQEYNMTASNQHFLLAEAAGDQSSSTLGAGDGLTQTFGGTLSLTNNNGTDTAIAPFSVIVVVGTGNGTVAAVDNGFGSLVSPPGFSSVSTGTVNYATGALSVTYSSAPTSSAPIKAYWKLANLGTHDMIVRYNLAYNIGENFINGSDGGVPGMRAYNNTMAHIGFEGSSTQQLDHAYEMSAASGAIVPHWTVMNSVYYDAWKYQSLQPPWTPTSTVAAPPAQTSGYGLIYDSSCSGACAFGSMATGAPGMVVNQSPLFNSTSTYDYTLQSGSPAKDVGTYLTTVASTDSGSGTTLVVNDAGFFQDGYGITGVDHDCISVTTVSNHVCITSVNYQTNTITLSSAITRSPSDPIWLYSNSLGQVVLVGSAPDLGAYELGQTSTYTVGGIVTGLAGTVVLQNASDTLTVSANSSFTFSAPTSTGGTYNVTVLTQPSGQTCSVSNGSGTVSSANVTSVSVSCTGNYTIGGTIAGLTGTVVLQNNAGDNLSVPSNGSFTFATHVNDSVSYAVTVLTQPSGQTCAISNGSGTVSAANVINVSVSCTTNPIVGGGGTTVSVGGGGGGAPYIPNAGPIATSSASSSSLVASSPSATSSVADLQALINSLTVQLQTLLAQAASEGIAIPSTGTFSFIFTRDLQLHDTGADVQMLQKFLNSKGFLVSESGPGSPGDETTVFASKTWQALIKFQKSAGIEPAAGYFGKLTRTYVNAHDGD